MILMLAASYEAEGAPLRTVRTLLLGILAIGMSGSGVDLLLIEHYEEPWQLAPLALIAAAIVVVGWVWIWGSVAAVRSLQVVMVAIIAAGAIGILLHYSGSREFQHEIDPELAGWALFVKVVTAKAPPALAPASLMHMGLLGLVVTYRHPALSTTNGERSAL